MADWTQEKCHVAHIGSADWMCSLREGTHRFLGEKLSSRRINVTLGDRGRLMYAV
jgi:hypothetical protein